VFLDPPEFRVSFDSVVNNLEVRISAWQRVALLPTHPLAIGKIGGAGWAAPTFAA
jgi:hypothetical protein